MERNGKAVRITLHKALFGILDKRKSKKYSCQKIYPSFVYHVLSAFLMKMHPVHMTNMYSLYEKN